MKKSSRIKTWIVSALASMAVAAPALAQRAGDAGYGDKQHKNQAQKQQKQQKQQQRGQARAKQAPGKAIDESPREAQRRMQKLREVSGTIIETKTVEMRGTDQQNVVALIRTSRGDRRLIVDLGPAQQLEQAKLREGEKIAVEGTVATIRDQQFLVASRVKANGQTIEVDRTAQRKLHQGKTGGMQRGAQPEQGQQQRRMRDGMQQ